MRTIETRIEAPRGCGYRRPGKDGVGIYLVSGGLAAPCGRLPIALDRCPTCDHGVKPARGWTWIEPSVLFAPARANPCPSGNTCATCPLGAAMPDGRHGLLWIGEGFYDMPADFMREASGRGVSRKIGALPIGFDPGRTWVYLAHRRAISRMTPGGVVLSPGVFTAFLPRVELVVESAEPAKLPERALRLADRLGQHATLVRVVRDVDAQTEVPTEVPH